MGQIQSSIRISNKSSQAQVIRVRPQKSSTVNKSRTRRKQKVTKKTRKRSAVVPVPKELRLYQALETWHDQGVTSQHHNVLYQTFSIISAGREVITLEALGRFISLYTDHEFDYHSLRELMHSATNSYEFTFEQFKHIMTMDPSVSISKRKMGRSNTGSTPTSDLAKKSSLDRREMLEQRKQEYGLFNIKRSRSLANPSKKPSGAVPPLLKKDGKFMSNLKRFQSLNHVSNNIEIEYATMYAAFQAFDREHSGTLSAENVRLVMQHIGLVKPSKKDIKSLFRLAGKKSTKEELTFEEFLRLFSLCEQEVDGSKSSGSSSKQGHATRKQKKSPSKKPKGRLSSFLSMKSFSKKRK